MTRILVIDDDLIYLDELSEGLRSMGHEVSPAPSSDEALMILEGGDVDLAICDTIMSGGGALTFLHEVRTRKPRFPVVVITGRDEIATSPLFTEGMREADAKIQKSATLSEIDRLVRSLAP